MLQLVARLAKDLLPAQPSSVANESVFSRSGDLIDEKRTMLADESIRSCMILCSHGPSHV